MEIWKTIPAFSGSYEASSLGRVRSIDRHSKNGHFYPGKILSQRKQYNGYKTVHLSYMGKASTQLVHRLVASAFLGSLSGMQINHKNEDKTDNRISNIELCSPSHNCKYGHRNDKMINRRKKSVGQYDENGVLLNVYPILNEAARRTEVNAAHICDVCKGKRNRAGGYIWKYV